MKRRELAQTEQAIEKMLELYENGAISKQRFSDRIAIHEKTKADIETEIERLNIAMAGQVNSVTVEMVQKRTDEFKALWSSAVTPSDQNRAYKLLVDKIVYDRENDGVTLEVLYR